MVLLSMDNMDYIQRGQDHYIEEQLGQLYKSHTVYREGKNMRNKIGIMTLDRMGSNHLLASLHYQNKIYSFQEGSVDFPSATPESIDAFGFGKDNEARNLKFNSSEYFVWKLDRRHIQYDMTRDLPPHKSYLEYFAANDLLIFNGRKPHYAEGKEKNRIVASANMYCTHHKYFDCKADE